MHRSRRTAAIPATLLLGSALLFSRPAFSQSSDRAAAAALFEAGREAVNRGDYSLACEKFQESNRLDEAVGTTFNLANCREQLGQFATAWELFDAVAQKLPESDTRQPIARDRARALEPRVPRLTLALPADAPRDLSVLRDGVELRRATFGVPLPVDPGDHQLIVRAPGHRDRIYNIRLVEGERRALEVEPGAASSEPVAPVSPGSAVPADEGVDEAPTSRSHAGQLGAVGRADADGQLEGAVGALGVSYGIGDHFEAAAVGLAGANFGVEPSIVAYVLTGAIKPRLLLGAPLFFVDGVRPGVRASGGMQWDPSRSVGIFLDLGGAFFPGDHEGYNKLVFVPSAGAQARIF